MEKLTAPGWNIPDDAELNEFGNIEFIDHDTMWEVDPETGASRHRGTGKGCFWTDWEGEEPDDIDESIKKYNIKGIVNKIIEGKSVRSIIEQSFNESDINKPWYAAMVDADDNDWWTAGSFDFDEAVEKMMLYGKDAYIAVIVGNECKEELHPQYYFNVDENFGNYRDGKEERRWGLHRVLGDTDELILTKAYVDTPGFEGDDDQDATDESWKALDNYIKSELGFLPDYEVN